MEVTKESWQTYQRNLFDVVQGPPNKCKPLQTGNDHIVLAERAVDNEQLSVPIPAAHDTHMLVAWVEDQIPREGLVPGDLRTVIVRCMVAPPPWPMMYSPPVTL